MEEYIRGIADAGVKVILSGGAFGEMAMHFIEKVCAGFVPLVVACNGIEWSDRQGSQCVLACEVVLCGQKSRMLLIFNSNGDRLPACMATLHSFLPCTCSASCSAVQHHGHPRALQV